MFKETRAQVLTGNITFIQFISQKPLTLNYNCDDLMLYLEKSNKIL